MVQLILFTWPVSKRNQIQAGDVA